MDDTKIWDRPIIVGRHTVEGKKLSQAWQAISGSADYTSSAFYMALMGVGVHPLAAGDVGTKMRDRAKRQGMIPSAPTSAPGI